MSLRFGTSIRYLVVAHVGKEGGGVHDPLVDVGIAELDLLGGRAELKCAGPSDANAFGDEVVTLSSDWPLKNWSRKTKSSGASGDVWTSTASEPFHEATERAHAYFFSSSVSLSKAVLHSRRWTGVSTGYVNILRSATDSDDDEDAMVRTVVTRRRGGTGRAEGCLTTRSLLTSDVADDDVRSSIQKTELN